MTTTIEIQIAEIAAKQKDDKWAARQQAARQQQADTERQRVERYRINRIAQIKNALEGIPKRKASFENLAAEADDLCAMLSGSVDTLASNYIQRVHSERHQARPIRLELCSEGAVAYFFGAHIKKSLRQLSLAATARDPGAPLLDAESFATELRDEEKRLRAELAELQLIA